ncbi:MAG: RNA polymerase sigma factor [Roseivirga sp.]|nr:RNA polymerase sigma factor [Roseivirga sp.]
MATLEELNQAFEDCKGQLKSYLLRITTDTSDAEDIVQETYLKAHANIIGFRGDSSLKTWLFAIGSNLARDLIKSKKRWPENVTDICKSAAMSNQEFFGEMMQIRGTSAQGNFEIKEHITFCFTCVTKSLPLEQHLVLLLKEVYGFKVKEIAGIIDNTEAMVKYYLHVSRTKMADIFDHRCALINKEGICHQCTELNGIFNPKQNAQEELAKIDMVRAAEDKSREELLDLRMKIVQSIDPFESGAAELQLRHLKHNNEVMKKHLGEE